jgi:septum formation topological specificity factor MinE
MEKTNRANKIKPTNRPKKLNIITNKKRRNKMEPKYVENLSEQIKN